MIKLEFAPGSNEICQPIDQVIFSDQTRPELLWQASEDSTGIVKYKNDI